MMTDKQREELAIDHETKHLRADVCLGSPESYTLDEKRQICEDMAASTVEVEAAMRADFLSMPEFTQKRLLELLAGNDPSNYDWWLTLLYHSEE